MAPARSMPWIHSPQVDLAFILGPSLIATLFGFLAHRYLPQTEEIPTWAWVLLVMAVDVGHVYSTLYRTYFDKTEFKKHQGLYVNTPVLCWLGGVALYSFGWIFFWRALAYLAVFHFIRQQYGFMRIYSRRDHQGGKFEPWIDRAVIYLATLYPLVYWHTHMPRNFHWFIEGDFVRVSLPGIERVFLSAYLAAILVYGVKEWHAFKQGRDFNLPKNLLVTGTLVSWYSGIVVFNADMAFTATNVIAHGIPYIALIWIYGHRKTVEEGGPKIGWAEKFRYVSMKFAPVFVIIIVFFGFVEEGLWDAMVWRERPGVFSLFWKIPRLVDASVLAWIIPLLALPQSTHYVLDGFIWRLKSPKVEWQKFVFGRKR